MLRKKYNPQKYADTMMSPESLEDLNALRKTVERCAADLMDPARRQTLEYRAEIIGEPVLRAWFAAEQLAKQGRERLAAGEARPAFEAFQEASRLNGDEPEYFLFCARAAQAMLVDEDAWNDAGRAQVESLLQNAVVQRPRYEEALIMLAELYTEKGDEPRALKTWQSILATNPRHTVARKAAAKLEADGVTAANKGVANRIGGLLGRFRKS